MFYRTSISDIQKIILTENNLIFNGANIIIPFDKSNYYIMAYYEGSSLIDYLFNLNLNISPINPLNCSNYYNYDQTECIDSIPEGYYCNNTLLKTIDKCHENCKTCKKGPTSINNNCLSCPSSGKKYYDLGNCTDDCVYGYFNMITDKVCKCSSNIKCYYCTEYSIQYDLCEVCNNDAGFYQKIDDERRSDKFINCYSNIEYYYYLQNKKYYPCYSTCKTCNENGTNIENNCTSCRDGYEFKNDLENDKNCYEICSKYYYYDSDNNYHCINICPHDYKLISDKKRCINDCSNDNIYKYEFNNHCYRECPNGTIISTDNIYKCEGDLICEENYYNYEHKECYSSIPDGYYLKNEDDKIIDKCHENCKTCNEGPTNDNNNCDECKSGYSFINNDKNCYQNCNYYFYFDSSQRYHCTDNCPSGYKLINQEKRCIDDCKKDDKYEYENKCYSICPPNTKVNENNICIPELSQISESSELSKPSEIIKSSDSSKFIYELICSEEYPFELIKDKKCVSECDIVNLVNKICIINNPKAKEIEANYIKTSITEGLIDNILTNITKNGEDLIINEKDIKYRMF